MQHLAKLCGGVLENREPGAIGDERTRGSLEVGARKRASLHELLERVVTLECAEAHGGDAPVPCIEPIGRRPGIVRAGGRSLPQVLGPARGTGGLDLGGDAFDGRERRLQCLNPAELPQECAPLIRECELAAAAATAAKRRRQEGPQPVNDRAARALELDEHLAGAAARLRKLATVEMAREALGRCAAQRAVMLGQIGERSAREYGRDFGADRRLDPGHELVHLEDVISARGQRRECAPA